MMGCMSRSDDVPPDDGEFLEIGPKRGVAGVLGVRRRPRLLLALVAAGVVAATVVAVARFGSRPPGSPPARATAAGPSSSPASSAVASSGAPSMSPVSVMNLGHPLLGVGAAWELFGRGPGVVVRIEFARGRITRTALPALQSGGPVSFVTDAEGALVRPIDFATGYLIPDGQPARVAPGVFGTGGPAFPGPDPRHLWVASGAVDDRMALAGMDGRGTGVRIAVPAGSSQLSAIPDQAGYLLFPGIGGVYDVRPGGTSRITTGTVLAVGPTRWLTGECDNQARCRPVVIDRFTGARHALNARLYQAGYPAGVISPDGTAAAVLAGSPSTRIEIINLATGAEHALPLRVASIDEGGESLVWSPDSRWLFLAANDDLYAVGSRTREILDLSHMLGTALPALTQLSIRDRR
jgi:hypothetical protein